MRNVTQARPHWSNLVEAHVRVKRVMLVHVLKLLALRRGPWGADGSSMLFLVYLGSVHAFKFANQDRES